MKIFGDFFIFLSISVDELQLTEKKEEEEEEEEEGEERRRRTKWIFLRRDYSTERKVRVASRVASQYISDVQFPE